MPQTDSVSILTQEYLTRLKRNSRYSIRAYSQALGISSGALSQILSRRRPLTEKQALKMLPYLNLEPKQAQQFIDNFQNRSNRKKNQYDKFKTLKEDEFSLIAEWYHYAILNLMDTRNFRSDERWVAERLSISTIEVQEAFLRLERLGFIKRQDDQWKTSGVSITTTHDIPVNLLKRAHEKAIEQARESIWQVDVNLRDITTISMAMNKKKLALAKKMIKKFRRELCQLVEDKNGDEVYSLNIQLFPLTKISKKEKK